MKVILTIQLPRLRNAEHNQFHYDILEAVPENFAAAKGIGVPRKTYADLFALEDNIFKSNRAYELTGNVEMFDRERDNLDRIVKSVINTNTDHPSEARSLAANKLAFVVRQYSDARSLPYIENTAELRNMLDALQDPANAAHLEALGLTGDVELLREANEKFDQAWKARSEEALMRQEAGNMQEIRPKVDAAYNGLTDAISAVYKNNEYVTNDPGVKAKCEVVIDKINAIILKVSQIVSRRSSGAASGDVNYAAENLAAPASADGDDAP